MSAPEQLVPGQTVQLSDGRMATLRFVGPTLFSHGVWVGVELPDDGGKNDGSVGGERYFDCEMGHGMFLRPMAVRVVADAPPQQRQQPQALPPASPGPARGAGAATAGLGTRKPSRPSSLLASGSNRVGAVQDPSLGRRISINAPSPSPGPRSSRPSSIARSPTKSPTKQLATAGSSASTSRTATPSNAGVAGTRASSMGVKTSRPSVGGGATRTSMGPPPIPAAGVKQRQSSVSSTSSRVTATSGPSRTLSGRASLTGAKGGFGRSDTTRSFGGTSQQQQNGASRRTSPDKSEEDSNSGPSPPKGVKTAAGLAPEVVSPQPKSPVLARASAIEKLAASANGGTSASGSPAAGGARGQAAVTVTARAGVNLGIQKENEDLKAKLRVLDRKRLEDREKLKAMEKLQTERDKFESIIKKLQAKMQPQSQEMAELRRQLKEAEERFDSVEALQAEHESALELATLDKEMADETAEFLKEELEMLKAKLEELELETEVLREENAEFTKGMSPEERASTGWLQMERNNERLREALIRLRDMTHQQEEELKDQIRSLEEDVQEYGKVKEQYEQSTAKLHESQAAVEELREQLDNALGAEDMIEDLTERNMVQSEQMEELRAIVDDLEALKEVNDELEATHVQNERELQEELDFKDSVITEQARRTAQQEESLEDMEYTLSRFRELVTSLQGDLEDMRASHAVTESESEQLNSRSRAMMDLNVKLQLSAAKAQAKTIDLELGKLEAQEATQHLEMVRLFLPENYADLRDSVLALLRFRRLTFKANLLHGFIKERVSGQQSGGASHQVGHEDDLFAGCDAMDKLVWVGAMCARFDSSISHCSPERFGRYQGALFELEPVERALNGWIDGMRRDELRERDCADNLARTVALMTHLAELHMGPTGVADRVAEADDDDEDHAAADDVDLEAFAADCHMRAVVAQSCLDSAATALHVSRAMVQRAVPPRGDDDEAAQLFARRAEAAIAQTRSAKVVVGKAVRELEDLRTRGLALPLTAGPLFDAAEHAAQELAALARQSGLDLHRLLAEEPAEQAEAQNGDDKDKDKDMDMDPSARPPRRQHTYADVQDSLQRTASSAPFLAASEADPLFGAYLSKLRALASSVADLAALATDLSQTSEFEPRPAPWRVRARQLADAAAASRPAALDAEEKLGRSAEQLALARRTLAARDEELSTERLKVATLESRGRDAAAKAKRLAELEARLRDANAAVDGLRDDVEKQDRELKNLEADRDKWRKVAEDASSSSAAGGGRGMGGASGEESAAAQAAAQAGRERAVATRREMDALEDDVASLQAAVRFHREDVRRAKLGSVAVAASSTLPVAAPSAALDWLSEPLARGSAPSAATRAAEQRAALVASEARAALSELLRMASTAELFDLGAMTPPPASGEGAGDAAAGLGAWRPASRTPQYHAAKQAEDWAAWKGWRDEVADKASVVLLTTGGGGGGGGGGAVAGNNNKLNGAHGGANAAPSAARKVAARMQIRLPRGAVPDRGKYYAGGGGADVQIVGSAEWEGLQGRLAAV